MADDIDNILDAMAPIESSNNPNAVSPKGARGLYQIMPNTARMYGFHPDDAFDPQKGRQIARRYVGDLLNRYKGDKSKALAAYNTGPTHVDKGFIPKATRSYVDKLLSALGPSSAEASEDIPTDANYWAKAKVEEPKAPDIPTDPDYWAKAKPDAPTFDKLPPEEAEIKRKQVEGGGTDMSDPLIENTVIGIGTGGIGAMPTALGFIPKTVGGKVLNAGAATAEQYLMGWASEKGAQYGGDLAGKPGAIVGSLAAPMLGGAAIGSATGAIKNLRAPVTQDVAKTAAEAGESAERGLYEKAPKQIHEFGEKVKAANEKASKRTFGVFEKSAALRQKEGKALTAGDKAARQQAVDKTGQAMMQDFFGRSPEETAAARRLPMEDLALHRANMRKSVFGPINRIADELGAQFRTASEGKLDNAVDSIKPVTKSVADANEWIGKRDATLSGPVNDLIKKMPVGEVDTEMESKIPGLLRGSKDTDPAAAQRLAALIGKWNRENSGQAIEKEDYHDLAIQALGGQSAAKPTVGQLLGWRTEASKLVASQRDHNQVVAMQLRDALDETLMKAGIDIPQPLRERWGLYKSMFDPSFRRNVATAVNPVKYGKKLFEEPERFLAIWRNASPDEQQSLKQLMADHVYTARYSPKMLSNKIDAGVLSEMFGNTPYSKLQAWDDTPVNGAKWESAIAGNPRLQQQIEAGKQQGLIQVQMERAKDLRSAYIELAEKLGPAGRGKLAKLLSAKTPEAAVQIGQREFPISPEAAQDLYRQAQITPGKAAFQANVESRALEKGLDVNKTREDAAVKVLMNDPSSPYAAGIKRRLYGYHLPVALGTLGAGAVMGHAGMGSSYQLGFSGMLMAMLAANQVRQMFRLTLTDPEAATQYYRALSMTPSGLNAKIWGARMARAAVAAGLHNQNPDDDEAGQ